jgi:hypothetical protein
VEETECSPSPEPQPPVPFILLLLAVSAGALAALPLLGACSLQMHRLLLLTGAVLNLPLMAFGAVLLFGGRAWILERFFEGEYSERATVRELPFLWYPEKTQSLEYTTGEVAGNKIETYATWETTAIVQYVENVRGGNRDGGHVVRDSDAADLQPGSKIRVQGLQNARELNGMQGTCQHFEQGRWRVQLRDGNVKNVKPENLQLVGRREGRSAFRIVIPASFGSDLKVTVDSSGTLNGHALPFQAKFDGSAIVATSGPYEGQAWRKAGYWHLGLVAKGLIAMAVLGIEAMFTAAVLPPGVISADNARMPLKAVFMVDGSTSITAPQWQSARLANKKFIEDFTDVYSSDFGKLNIGFVQFSTEAFVEHPITSQLSSVTAMLDTMQQRGGDTRFDNALDLCQRELDAYTEAGPNTFDICVLITDGEDRSFKPYAELKAIAHEDTAVFGIFVGNDVRGASNLHHIVGCGKAENKHNADCDFFASATDFDVLAERTREIAEDVARHSDIALCAERSALIEGPFLISLVLPFVLWYLSCCTMTIAKRRLNNYKALRSDNHLLMLEGA